MHIVCPHCRNPIEVVEARLREEVACPSCGSSFRLEGGSTTAVDEHAGRKVGRFEIVEAVGQGAFGTVFKARDPELDRVVALKVPRAGNLAGAQERDRFLREARSAAQLRHPSIVTVHEVGEDDGVPYLVSDFVEGVTLADLLSARRPGFREAAGLIMGLAEALQYAHERGVVHRDVKPSNVMIGADGRAVLMDFGLAKRDAGEITMTVEGQVLGTPAYMSPEQARGDAHGVDGRSDVYSLGVMLYQLLTGELPFRGTKRMLLHQVLHDDPRPPRSLNDKIPRDLETVCLKAMAKEPARRYATAQELADDLRRWLAGEPIKARPVGSLERAARWVRRHPTAAALVAMTVVALLAAVGLAVGLAYNGWLAEAYRGEEAQRIKAEGALAAEQTAKGREEVERKRAEAERKRAEDALTLVGRLGYFHSLALAETALRDGSAYKALERLTDAPEQWRDWEWHYLHGRCRSELFSFAGDYPVFSPDGSLVATRPDKKISESTDAPPRVQVYDARTGREVYTLPRCEDPRFSPDGELLVVKVRGEPGFIEVGGNKLPAEVGWALRIVEARTGREVYALKEYLFQQFSSDGSRLIVQSLPLPGDRGFRRFRVVEARTGREAFTFAVPLTPPGNFSLSVQEKYVAGTSDEGRVVVYDLRSGREVSSFWKSPGTGDVAFSGDEARAIVRGPRGPAAHDVQTGEELTAFTSEAVQYGLSPARDRVAVMERDGATRIHDTETGRVVAAFNTQAGAEYITFAPDGERVVLHYDTLKVLHDARTGRELYRLDIPLRGGSLAFRPDGSRLAVTTAEGAVRLLHAETGRELFRIPAGDRIVWLYFSPDGSRLAAGTDWLARPGRVWVYDVRASAEVPTIKVPKDPSRVNLNEKPLVSLVFSPDGKRLAANVQGHSPRVYDLRSGRQLFALPVLGGGERYTAYYSHGGTRFGVLDGLLKYHEYDAETGREVSAVQWPRGLYRYTLSPDGALAGAMDRDYRRWHVFDPKTGRLVRIVGVQSHNNMIAYDPTGRRIAATAADGVVRVYDTWTGQDLALLGAATRHRLPTFTRDGTRLLFRGPDRLPIVDAATGEELLTIEGLPSELGFHPLVVGTEKNVLIGGGGAGFSGTGDVLVFDVRTGGPLFTLKAQVGLRYASAFSPGGTRLAGVDSGGVLRLYDGDMGREALALSAPHGLQGPVFSPDGSRLAASSGDEVRVYEAPRDIPAWQAERGRALAADLPAWHRDRADEAEVAGKWFVAEHHLGCLLRGEPENAALYLHRGRMRAALDRRWEAAADFEKALAAKQPLSATDQGHALAWLGRWDEAGKQFARDEGAGKVELAWLSHARARLQVGDHARYAAVCARLAAGLGPAPTPQRANNVAWACALGPDALPDLRPVLGALRAAVAAQPQDSNIRNTLGALLYRAGAYEEAVRELEASITLRGRGRRATEQDTLFLAMAHHRLGHRDEASRELTWPFNLNGTDPADQLERRILRREAERLIRPLP